MTLQQISVFLENRLGQLESLTNCLAKNNINMRALSLAETSEFGIARIIVDDIKATTDLLAQEGVIYTVSEVLGVTIPDEPGGLNKVLRTLAEGGINIEYMYAFLGRKEDAHAYMIFHVQDAAAAIAQLSAAQISCLSQKELVNL